MPLIFLEKLETQRSWRETDYVCIGTGNGNPSDIAVLRTTIDNDSCTSYQ